MFIQNKLTSVCVGKHLISGSAGLGLPLTPFTKEPCKKMWDLNPTVAWGHFCAGLWDLSVTFRFVLMALFQRINFHTESVQLVSRFNYISSIATTLAIGWGRWRQLPWRLLPQGLFGMVILAAETAGWQVGKTPPQSQWCQGVYETRNHIQQSDSVHLYTKTVFLVARLECGNIFQQANWSWNTNLGTTCIISAQDSLIPRFGKQFRRCRSYCPLSWKQYGEQIQRKPSSGRKASKEEPINSWFPNVIHRNSTHCVTNMGFPLQYVVHIIWVDHIVWCKAVSW